MSEQILFQPLVNVQQAGIFVALSLIMLLSHQMYKLLVAEYKEWLSLGPCGAPASFRGYCQVRYLALYALKDVFSPTKDVETEYFQVVVVGPGKLQGLPARRGQRPIVNGIVPHRQINQRPDKSMLDQILNRMKEIAANHATHVISGVSCFEKQGSALFAAHGNQSLVLGEGGQPYTPASCSPSSSYFPSGITTPRGPSGSISTTPMFKRTTHARNCTTEACHLHASDGGSMHLVLHPADRAQVLHSGWGELHPLAGGGWLENHVPRGFMLVYAPRDAGELEIVMHIVRAALWWVGGVDLDGEWGSESELDLEKHYDFKSGDMAEAIVEL